MSNDATINLTKFYFAQFSMSDLQALQITLHRHFGPDQGPVWLKLVDQVEHEIRRRQGLGAGGSPTEAQAIELPLDLTAPEVASGLFVLITLTKIGLDDRWRSTFGTMALLLTELVRRF